MLTRWNMRAGMTGCACACALCLCLSLPLPLPAVPLCLSLQGKADAILEFNVEGSPSAFASHNNLYCCTVQHGKDMKPKNMKPLISILAVVSLQGFIPMIPFSVRVHLPQSPPFKL